MELIKYGISTEPHMENVIELKYKKEYSIENLMGNNRLIVSPEKHHINMMLKLLGNEKDCEYFILYVLIVSRCDNELGRYQIANTLTWDELKIFCNKYSNYLETDGRHNFWIINCDTNDLVVYDRHNVLYVYENLESKIKILEKHGFKEAENIIFKTPHCHVYNKENDSFEKEIIENYEWIFSTLMDGDE